MLKPDPVETILARLIPPALSVAGQHDINAMLDELAAASAMDHAPATAHKRFKLRIIAGGLAASGAAAILTFFMMVPKSPLLAKISALEALPEFVLVGESDRVESMTDEGWQEDSDGSTMQAMRLSVVEENTLRDNQSGIEMKISEPREEMVLMPISTF